MRIDAVATWPVFGVLCHELIRIAECVRKPPCAKHSDGGCRSRDGRSGSCPDDKAALLVEVDHMPIAVQVGPEC